MKSKRELAQDILTPAGITLNGKNPWDPQIHNEALYERLFSSGIIAIGEGYMDGWWDVEDLPELMSRVLRSKQVVKIFLINATSVTLNVLKSKLFNLQSKQRAVRAIQRHYDIGNDLYERMLDESLTYTCGYWKDAKTLAQAQRAKNDLVCRKIGLKAGDRVLDIGCGWGAFAIHAAREYGAHVVGVTISKEQLSLAQERTKGLPIEIRFQDYRDVADGPYDHIVSIGMFEAVGYKNYKLFMQKVKSLLKEDGLFLLHTIGWHDTTNSPDPWIDKYIFPDGILPSANLITEAADHEFVLEDWHNFGTDYEKTLLEWFKNFDAHWPELREKYGDTFYRMWKFYLLSSAGSFRSRAGNLWQIVLSPRGVKGGYHSIR